MRRSSSVAQGILYHSVTLTRADQVDGFLRTITDRPDLAERVTAEVPQVG
jgi:hypothetical protein